MAISFQLAKKLCKLSFKFLIGILVVDIFWTLIRFLIAIIVYEDSSNVPYTYYSISNIVTNSFFIIGLGILIVGLFFISKFYLEISKITYVVLGLLFSVIMLRITFILNQFFLMFNPSNIIETATQIQDLLAYVFFIAAFIVFNFYQNKLKLHSLSKFGFSFVPYLFGFFGLIYPIINLMNLLESTYQSQPYILSFVHILTFFAVMLEIILFFDTMRRIDSFVDTTIKDNLDENKTE
jgi:hypothetical protein